ncbi:modulator of macroautophagy TMEM150B isoform X6 [Manis javanica]|uniref:modulator of macroautophagy TMEM150B isoform X6 n=1 Tax=Manis javanica TaxID=9974 RepID=UPI003C6DAA0A
MVVWPSRPPCLPRLPPGEFRPGLKFWPAFRAGGCTEEGNGGAAEGQKVHPGGRQAWAWVPCAPRGPDWDWESPRGRRVPHRTGMWGYLSLLPAFLALWGVSGVWTVFAIAVANGAVNLTEGFPYIRAASSASCSTWELLWLRDWGVGKWPNQLILWTGLLCALGTSVVGNFQQKNQLPTHLTGAFFAFFVGNLYFWLQLLLFWRMRGLPQPGAPWIGPLRLGLCGLCTILMVASILAGAESGQFFPRTRMDAGSRGTRIPSGEQIRTEGRGEGEDLEGEEQGVGDTRTDGPVRPDLLSHPNQPVPPLPHPTP